MSQAVLDALQKKFGDAILETSSEHGDEVAVVAREKLVEIATFLRDDEAMSFEMPLFNTATDYLGLRDAERFDVVWSMRSLTKRHRIRLKVRCGEDDLKVPTLCGLWPGFNWLERETYDMYGVVFEGHPDLRRIYMYEEFVGYPLRKDYPKEKRQPLVRRDWGNE